MLLSNKKCMASSFLEHQLKSTWDTLKSKYTTLYRKTRGILGEEFNFISFLNPIISLEPLTRRQKRDLQRLVDRGQLQFMEGIPIFNLQHGALLRQRNGINDLFLELQWWKCMWLKTKCSCANCINDLIKNFVPDLFLLLIIY